MSPVRSRDVCASKTNRLAVAASPLAKVLLLSDSERRQRGFSTLELTFVIVMSLAVMAMSVIQMQPFLQQTQADSAQQQLKESLREAREWAISQRRTMVVQFTGTKTTTLYQVAEPSNVVSTTPYLSLVLPGAAQFMTFSTEIDTPDAFGKPASGGIEFGGNSGTPTAGVQFQSDGTFTDGNGNPINGTIFIGLPNVPSSARAITILGNTGRIKVYQYTGTSWVQ
jgi:type II secretory pathway pseudopilin PulG